MPADRPEQPLIVPMTLAVDDYLAEIVGGLRPDGHDVRHVALRATPATILRRLRARGFGLRDLWAADQIDRCVAVLARPEYAVGIDTDDLDLDQVVEGVAAEVGLDLVRPPLRPTSAGTTPGRGRAVDPLSRTDQNQRATRTPRTDRPASG